MKMIKDFSKVKFKGNFRVYQKRVIDNSCKHLHNNKIHIVAAPGSGKTILGLELIRMLDKPALILSPTIAIREQWKDRFSDMFLPSNIDIEDYFSCVLSSPKLLTSITYQGLYTAYRKTEKLAKATTLEEEDGDDSDFPKENYCTIDLIKLMKDHNISTICLDEAHHLRAEWQRALYEFVKQVEHSVTIIALTATPPYDSSKAEWDKYIAMCGPIDEEIFVPELVRTKALCPHQDFICYNFPSQNEVDLISKYNQKVSDTVAKIFAEGEFLRIIQNSRFYNDPLEFEDELASEPSLFNAMILFLEASGYKPKKQFVKVLEKCEKGGTWDLSVAQNLLQGMMDNDQLFCDKDRDFVKNYLSRYGLVEKKRVKLLSCEEHEKLLITSTSKLGSIDRIVDREWVNLGENIRLLVLTDYIRLNSSVLGSDKEINELGVIPIFELLRRKCISLKIAAVSGRIVIVPNSCLDGVAKIAKESGAKMKAVPIKGIEYSELKFEGSNNAQKIAVITNAFNTGILNGIVGTKSLLGEGWDSPVINTLILASCVGSFMLSNQMRGRAIRMDKNKPDKVSNIWHLTTILPDHLSPKLNNESPPSADFDTLSRRFKSFLGLSYFNDVIESGIIRANTLKAPYDEASINSANEKMTQLANGRLLTDQRWQQTLANSADDVLIQNEIPSPKKGFFPSMFIRPSHYSTIKKITHAILKTFKDLHLIHKKARALFEKNFVSKSVHVSITKCSKYEKNIFHQAMSEVFAPIDNQKYLLVKTKRNKKIDKRYAFAVPEIFANRKENAEKFLLRMTKRLTTFGLYFTRSAEGKKILANVKRRAYVNKHFVELHARMKLRVK
ncbi:MAG: DEAD/DEAH box helicase family protein [Firmicutes bacterium]|nr:DEAD/DEAH box helicase family protein [Bacillota bacterium]